MITRKNYKMTDEDKNLILFLEGEDMSYPISKMREDKQKYYDKHKMIFSIGLAHQLLMMGNKIVDVVHHNEKKDYCVFVFKNNIKLQNDLETISGINNIS